MRRGSGRQGSRRAADRSEHLVRSPRAKRTCAAGSRTDAWRCRRSGRGPRAPAPAARPHRWWRSASLPEHQRHHVRRRRRRRPCSGGPSRAAPSGRPRGPRPSRSPRAASSGPGAGRRPGPRSRAAAVSVPGRRHGAVAQVVVDVEVGVVDPDRLAHAQGHEAHLLAVARGQVQLALDHRPQLLERRRRSLEDADAADVHRGHVVLDVEEHRVLRRSSPAMRSPPSRSSSVLELAGRRRVDRHPAVAPVDLDASRVRDRGTPASPRFHRCGSGPRVSAPPGRAGASRQGPELGAAGAVPAVGREHAPRTPRSPKPGDGPDRAQHRRARPPADRRTGEPEGDQGCDGLGMPRRQSARQGPAAALPDHDRRTVDLRQLSPRAG